MSYAFASDRVVLDLVATVAERGTTHLEHLPRPVDLARWAVASGLVDSEPAVTAAELDEARALREACYRLVAALIGAAPPRRADVTLVNRHAAAPGPAPVLRTDGSVRHQGGIAAVLAAVARDAVELHTGPDRDRLRWCDGERCTRAFVDRSRGGRRRWCEMRGCGDRSKAAAYRARQREEPTVAVRS